MHGQQVKQFEQRTAEVLRQVLRSEFERDISPQVAHLMAKAAIAVLEAVDLTHTEVR